MTEKILTKIKNIIIKKRGNNLIRINCLNVESIKDFEVLFYGCETVNGKIVMNEHFNLEETIKLRDYLSEIIKGDKI